MAIPFSLLSSQVGSNHPNQCFGESLSHCKSESCGFQTDVQLSKQRWHSCNLDSGHCASLDFDPVGKLVCHNKNILVPWMKLGIVPVCLAWQPMGKPTRMCPSGALGVLDGPQTRRTFARFSLGLSVNVQTLVNHAFAEVFHS